MDRKTGRALAKSTLDALGLFGQITDYEPDRFDAPVIATVHSKSLAMLQDARYDFSGPVEIWISIYVRRAPNQGAHTEDLLDDLTRDSMRALWNAFYDASADLQIGPSEAGIPRDAIDGKHYRMERFSVRFTDDAD